MKPDDIILGQFYVIEENTGDDNLECFLRGTNRVVKIVRRADYTSKAFIAEHYGFPINSEWIKCWVPGVGELAEFSDNGFNWSAPKEFTGYITGSDIEYPYRSNIGSGYRYVRPVQKKAEPDRHQVPLPLTEARVKEIVEDVIEAMLSSGLDIKLKAMPFTKKLAQEQNQ